MTENRIPLSAIAEAKILDIEQGTGWPNEDKMQAAYFQWAVNLYPELKYRLFHVPNGAIRHAVEANKVKAMGLTGGEHDLVMYTHAPTVVVPIELKLRTGHLSKDQIACHAALSAIGIVTHVIYEDFGQFKGLIELYR